MSTPISEKYLLAETAAHLGVEWNDPSLQREFWQISDGSSLSSLRWGDETPQAVFLHGGGQNAHTWDAVALLLGKSIVAIDMPGHGHSDWREDKAYWPLTNAAAVAEVIDQMNIGTPVALIGMSLGGLTAIRLAAIRPDLFSSVTIVDVTPSQMGQMKKMSQEEKGTTALTQGPTRYETLDDMIKATAALAPNRSAVLIERGVVHNAREFDDGQWGWRYDKLVSDEKAEDGESPDFDELWEDVSVIAMPMMLVRGGASAFVTEEHVDDFKARAPQLRFEIVDGAGHSVQSDRPAELAAVLNTFI
jgi:esterase